MYYPWNINGVNANVIEECLYINIGTYKEEEEEIGEFWAQQIPWRKKIYGAFVIYLILGCNKNFMPGKLGYNYETFGLKNTRV